MTTPQALIDQYLSIQQQKANLDQQLTDLENQIADYCSQQKIKKLSTKTHILYLVKKLRTVFPSKSDARRKQLEQIISQSILKDKFATFDIIKLAQAFDKDTLPSELKSRLEPLVSHQPYLKITVLPTNK